MSTVIKILSIIYLRILLLEYNFSFLVSSVTQWCLKPPGKVLGGGLVAVGGGGGGGGAPMMIIHEEEVT